jgi:pyruvate,water dikinase
MELKELLLTMKNDIVNIANVTPQLHSSIGGKALNLARLNALGYNVPAAFIVLPGADLSVLTTQQRIISAFESLNCELVAVRSSASVEDSIKYSFAGMFETFLDVKKVDLLGKIIECRNSLNTNRVENYLTMNQLQRSNIEVSVIVQQMLAPDYAGVCFTKNPVNNDSSELLIETVRGQGEQLVSGQVIPETVIVSKVSKAATRSGENIISDQSLEQLIETAQTLEKHYGDAIDIEWAVVNDTLYILQVRPITT